MKAYLDLYADRANPPKFDPPGNIIFMPVDRHTGEPTTADAEGAVTEAFIAGTQPSLAGQIMR